MYFKILHCLIVFLYLSWSVIFIVFSVEPYLDLQNNGHSWSGNETLNIVPYFLHPVLYSRGTSLSVAFGFTL